MMSPRPRIPRQRHQRPTTGSAFSRRSITFSRVTRLDQIRGALVSGVKALPARANRNGHETDLPWFPIYPKDFLADTRWILATSEQRGAVMQLLFHVWISGPVQDDDASLALLSGLGDRWAASRDRVLEFFVLRDDGRIDSAMLSVRRASAEHRSEHARKAANERWKRNKREVVNAPSMPDAMPDECSTMHISESEPYPDTESEREEVSRAVARAPRYAPADLVRDWNEAAKATSIVCCRELNPKRERNARARLNEQPDRGYWLDVIQRISESAFCQGQTDRGWRADFDFLVKPGAATSALEGKYDNHTAPQDAKATKNLGAARRFVGQKVLP
jgi:uncharacterized protein YdaU (DUF1376 family)